MSASLDDIIPSAQQIRKEAALKEGRWERSRYGGLELFEVICQSAGLGSCGKDRHGFVRVRTLAANEE